MEGKSKIKDIILNNAEFLKMSCFCILKRNKIFSLNLKIPNIQSHIFTGWNIIVTQISQQRFEFTPDMKARFESEDRTLRQNHVIP
jgi:hypothetical protein